MKLNNGPEEDDEDLEEYNWVETDIEGNEIHEESNYETHIGWENLGAY